MRRGETVNDVFKRIKSLIYYNQIVPGQKLLYRELARKLNTSITPVVQALKGLERANLVGYERNRGYFVLELDPREADQLFAVRECLEMMAIPLAIKNFETKRSKDITTAFKDHAEATGPMELRQLMLMDLQFHLAIAKIAGNDVLCNTLEQIFEQILLKYHPEYMFRERLDRVISEHREILKSLRILDVAKTRKVLRQHIRKGKKHIVASLKRHRANTEKLNM